MAAKKKPASTPKQQADKQAAKERNARNRARGVSVQSHNVQVIDENTVKEAEARVAKRMAKEDTAGEELANEAKEVGNINKALKLAENDTGRPVDEIPEEDAFIGEGLSSGNEDAIGSGYTEASSTMSKAAKEAAKETTKEEKALAKRLDVPSAIFAQVRKVDTIKNAKRDAERKAENLRLLEISRQRRADQEREQTTPTRGPIVYRDVDNPEEPVRGAIEPGKVIWSKDSGRVGKGTAVELPGRGRTIPLTKKDIRLSNQFWGFTPSSADSTPDTVYKTDPETGDLIAKKGKKGTFRITRTRKREDAILQGEKRNVENDAALGEMLATVAESIPESVPTGEIAYRVGSAGEAPQPRELRRPAVAEDLDPNSEPMKLLRAAAAATVTGFGEMGRAGQKRPSFGGTTAPGVSPQDRQKSKDRNSPEQDAYAAFRKLSGGQFKELKDFAIRAKAAAENKSDVWTPDLGSHTAEGVPLPEANVSEEDAKSFAEKMYSGSDIGNRSIPVMTAPPELDPSSFVGEKHADLIRRINEDKQSFGGDEGIAKLIDVVNNPRSKINTKGIQTTEPEEYSAALTDEQIAKINEASIDKKATAKAGKTVYRAGSPAGIHKQMKFLRRQAGVKAPATRTESQDLELVMAKEGQTDKIIKMMTDFEGRGGGEPAQGHALGSDESADLGKVKKSRTRPSRSIKVTNVNNLEGQPLEKPETVSVPTGEPAYTGDELEVLARKNPDLARVYDPVSDLRLPRAGGAPIPRTASTLVGTDVRGNESARRLAMVREGEVTNVPRATATPPGEPGEPVKPVDYEYNTELISPPSVEPGTVYFPTLSGQFKASRVVRPGTPGLASDLYRNPVVTNAEDLARTPAARRALNERTRMAGIQAAKEVSKSRKSIDVDFRPGRAELGQVRRAADVEQNKNARSEFLSQPESVKRTARQNIFIQQPAVERQINPIGAALLGKYAEDTGQVFTDNPSLKTEGKTGEVIGREGVLQGQSRDVVMNKVIDQMKYASGYVAPSNMSNVYNRFRETPTINSPLSESSEDPRDKKTSTKQLLAREYGSPSGSRERGRGVMEGDQWGAMRGAPVTHKGDKIRKPGDTGYVGLEGLNTPTTPESPDLGASVGASINAQYGGATGTPNFGVVNPRTTRINPRTTRIRRP